MCVVKERVYEIICLFLDEKIKYKNIVEYISTVIPVSDAVKLTDELTREAYMAMFHSNEQYCEIAKEEMIYYRNCFEGKEVFLKEKRDLMITENNVRIKKIMEEIF